MKVIKTTIENGLKSKTILTGTNIYTDTFMYKDIVDQLIDYQKGIINAQVSFEKDDKLNSLKYTIAYINDTLFYCKFRIVKTNRDINIQFYTKAASNSKSEYKYTMSFKLSEFPLFESALPGIRNRKFFIDAIRSIVRNNDLTINTQDTSSNTDYIIDSLSGLLRSRFIDLRVNEVVRLQTDDTRIYINYADQKEPLLELLPIIKDNDLLLDVRMGNYEYSSIPVDRLIDKLKELTATDASIDFLNHLKMDDLPVSWKKDMVEYIYAYNKDIIGRKVPLPSYSN